MYRLVLCKCPRCIAFKWHFPKSKSIWTPRKRIKSSAARGSTYSTSPPPPYKIHINPLHKSVGFFFNWTRLFGEVELGRILNFSFSPELLILISFFPWANLFFFIFLHFFLALDIPHEMCAFLGNSCASINQCYKLFIYYAYQWHALYLEIPYEGILSADKSIKWTAKTEMWICWQNTNK